MPVQVELTINFTNYDQFLYANKMDIHYASHPCVYRKKKFSCATLYGPIPSSTPNLVSQIPNVNIRIR